MSSLLTRMRDDSGQAFVFVAATLMVLVGMAALVVDGGSWYQADRRLQTAADAGALAGAQHLPTEQSEARTVALDYAQRNYAGIPAPAVSFPDAGTINVSATAQAPGIFARIFSIDEVTVHAQAQARVFAPEQAEGRRPNRGPYEHGVHRHGPDLLRPDEDADTQGGLRVRSDQEQVRPPRPRPQGGHVGAGDLKDWIEDGYPGHLPINTDYPPANGEKNGIKKQLEDAADEQRTLLFPVFDTANASTGYHVIGWAAFVIDDVVKWTGKNHELRGHFVTFIATDLAAGNPITDPNKDFGVHVIALTQ